MLRTTGFLVGVVVCAVCCVSCADDARPATGWGVGERPEVAEYDVARQSSRTTPMNIRNFYHVQIQVYVTSPDVCLFVELGTADNPRLVSDTRRFPDVRVPDRWRIDQIAYTPGGCAFDFDTDPLDGVEAIAAAGAIDGYYRDNHAGVRSLVLDLTFEEPAGPTRTMTVRDEEIGDAR